MDFLVAAWGDPWSWEEVEYEGLGRRVESVTSLSLLRSLYPESRILIVVQETLLAANRYDGRNRRVIERGYPDPWEEIRRGSEYREALGKLAEAVRDFAVGEFEKRSLPTEDIKVAVAPGTGIFGYLNEDNEVRKFGWRLSENLMDRGIDVFSLYQSVAMLHILHEMLGSGEELTVHLDLTHGLNYASTGIYRALLFASRVYATLNATSVAIKIYNSEPYNRLGEKKLHLWRIRDEVITRKKALSRLFYALSLAEKGEAPRSAIFDLGPKSGELYRKFGNEVVAPLEDLRKIGDYAGPAAFYGLPLLLLQAGSEVDQRRAGDVGSVLKDCIEKLFDFFPSVEVGEQNGIRYVEHRTASVLNGLKALLASVAMASYAARAWECSGRPTSVNGCVTATMEHLKRVREWIAGPLKPVVDHELSMLECASRGKLVSAVGLYGDLKEASARCRSGETLPRRAQGEVQPNKRILVAHSGFQEGTVEVTCLNGEPAVRYRPEALKRVKEAAKGLKGELCKMLVETKE